MSEEQLTSALNIMRRMPPSKIEQSLSGLINLVPEMTDDLLQRVDQPLQVAVDSKTSRQYLLCDYNRDGDSYRSPWSNEYDPPLEDGFMPSATLRELEVATNEVFDAYRELYYQGGVSSVYLWDLENGDDFAGCFLIKKEVDGGSGVRQGSWDSIHVIEVQIQDAREAIYKLTTTVMLSMAVDNESAGNVLLAGNLTRQAETKKGFTDKSSHIANMGEMVENMEISLRSNLDQLYIGKTREVINGIRRLHAGPSLNRGFAADLGAAIAKHGAGRKMDSE